MNWLKVAPVILALVGVAFVVGCESSPSGPDMDVAPSAVGDQNSALSTTGPLYGRGNEDLGVVKVLSDGLCYETFVPVDPLPPHGRFQDLYQQADGPSETAYGPGDPGYLGGRWRVHDPSGAVIGYLLCPLLPPGQTCPE